MTHLYRDPANAYIRLDDMLRIARDKIEGKDIESALRDARQRAFEEFELNNEMTR